MADNMDQNSDVRVNWRTINIPSLAAIFTVGVVLWSASSDLSARLERFDARLDAIEESRKIGKIENDKRLDVLYADVGELKTTTAQTTYRLTLAEASIKATNDRQDRFADALGDVRDGIARLNTSIELLTQRLENVVPLKKSSLEGTPSDLVLRTGR